MGGFKGRRSRSCTIHVNRCSIIYERRAAELCLRRACYETTFIKATLLRIVLLPFCNFNNRAAALSRTAISLSLSFFIPLLVSPAFSLFLDGGMRFIGIHTGVYTCAHGEALSIGEKIDYPRGVMEKNSSYRSRDERRRQRISV